ncbi:MAG: GNAT family N-acetyltransferase [Chloroflexota bacterium]
MTLALWPFVDSDYPVFVEISNESFPDYGWTVDEVRHWDADWQPTGYFERRMIAEQDGVAAGYSNISQARGQFVPDNYNLDIVVRPPARQRGIGAALYADAERALRLRKAHWVRNGVKESLALGVAFARKVGAVELRRDWESRLDVTRFDPAAFAAAPVRVAGAGIRMSTLADELRTDADAVRKAYELHAVVRIDVPGLDPATPSPYERFEAEVLRAPSALPEAYFIAIRDGWYVGESALGIEGTDATVIHQFLTGVLRHERGTGIAMALKLRTIEYARAKGFLQIRTWNNSLNRPMLAINEALGFVREPAWITFGKDMSAS